MNMKAVLKLIPCFLFLLLFASCSKEQDNTPTPPEIKEGIHLKFRLIAVH